MSLTATYSDTIAGVTVSVASGPANATSVLIERSTDQVHWSTVRGTAGGNLGVAGGAATVIDYEFADDVINYYRATYSDSTAPTYVSSAAISTTTASGATATVTPALPSGLTDGDTVYLILSCTKATATFGSAITGFTGIWNSGELALYGARWVSGIAAPTITWSGLASGDICMAKCVRYRNAGISTGSGTISVVGQANTSAQNIAYADNPSTGVAALFAYKSATNTALSPAATDNDKATGYTLAGYHASASPTSAGTITVTGGSSAISNTLAAVIQPYGAPLATQDSGSVTPSLSTAWIKNPLRPYLNRAVMVTGIAPISHKSRTTVYDILQRSNRVAVTDLYGPRDTTLTVRTDDEQTMADLIDCLLTGEVAFVHAPAGARTPTGYYAFGDIEEDFPSATGQSRTLTLPASEVAAPDPSLAAVSSTYQTVVNTYATYQALATAKATYADVLLLVGTAADTITG